MIVTDRVKAALRPFLSANWPMIKEPRGRIKKPIAKTAAVESNSAVWLLAGKNAAEK